MFFASSVAVTHRTLGTLDLVIIGIYFVIIFGIGFYFSKKERTSEDYFLASRNIGWFAIGASLFVSNISTEHFIGLAGSGATSGLAVGHFEWLACLILLLLGFSVLFVEDTTGDGHITRTLEGTRGFAHIPVGPAFDITRWPLA